MGGPPSASERGGRPFKEASDLARAKGRGTHFMRGRVDVGRYLWENPHRREAPALEVPLAWKPQASPSAPLRNEHPGARNALLQAP